jgi:hypothetical protein
MMKLGQCAALTTSPLTGTWYRAIQPKFWTTALATAHTRTIPSRFSAASLARPGFELLYLAEDHQVALFETQALLGSPLPGSPVVPNPASAWVIVNVSVALSNVANLCSASERKLIGTSVQELTGDWRGYVLRNPRTNPRASFGTPVPTQKLGAALNAVPDLEGFTTYSAKVPTHRNLVVFPQKVRPGSQIRLTLVDPSTGRLHTATIP